MLFEIYGIYRYVSTYKDTEFRIQVMHVSQNPPQVPLPLINDVNEHNL